MSKKTGKNKKTRGADSADVDAFLTKCIEMGLTEDTGALLVDRGITSVTILHLLAGEEQELVELCRPLDVGQRIVLRSIVRGQEQKQITATDRVADTDRSEPLAAMVEALRVAGSPDAAAEDPFRVAPGGAPAAAQMSEPMVPPDPAIYGRGGCSARKPYYDIADYINAVPTVENEQAIGEDGSVQVVVRNMPRRPQLQHITIEEWGLANASIMMEMLRTEELTGRAIFDYLAYTIKICELFRGYERTSVLSYDRQFRFLQAQHDSMRWATDALHLHTVMLRVKPPTGAARGAGLGGASSARGRASSNTPAREQQICRLFNSRGGCTYNPCRFSHVCSEAGCRAEHPRTRHPDVGRKQQHQDPSYG